MPEMASGPSFFHNLIPARIGRARQAIAKGGPPPLRITTSGPQGSRISILMLPEEMPTSRGVPRNRPPRTS